MFSELKILFLVLLLSSFTSFSQSVMFKGHSGVYFLGTADLPVAQNIYAKNNISGVVVRIRWESLETEPDVFIWDYLDNELAKAESSGKKCSIALLGTPGWLSQLDATKYYYIDKNTYHSTYGDTLFSFIPWDDVYVDRLKKLITRLAEKYSTDSRISYWNLVSGQMSRNLPDSVVTAGGIEVFPVWSAYQPDTLIKRMKEVLDVYMNSFFDTPLWASMDYQRFEPAATGHSKNYVAGEFSNYGISRYPDRFGVWREDLSACNPNLATLQSSSQWFIMKQNPCRSGAQMVWSVQDGPSRMNQCGIIPSTESFVLDSAVQHGLTLGMQYIEIYGADINDSSLDEVISKANNLLIAKANSCSDATSYQSFFSEELFRIYPNPTSGLFTLEAKSDRCSVEIYNSYGQLVFKWSKLSSVQTFNLRNHPSGVYLVRIRSEQKNATCILSLLHR